VAAIIPFIEGLTDPGDVIVDPFAGSGMTGLAAHLSGRRARLSDISVLGKHVAQGYLARVTGDDLRSAANDVVTRARSTTEHLYATQRAADGDATEMVRTVWSFTFVCPDCAEELLYFDHVTRRSATSNRDDQGRCSRCGSTFVRRRWSRGRCVPVQVVVRASSGRLVTQSMQTIDEQAIRRAMADPRLNDLPTLEIDEDREMYKRSALSKHGLTDTGRFFSARNAVVLLELWRAIDELDVSSLRKKLAFAFTAILPRASRRYQWSPQRPLNAQNQTYYIAPVHFEWNVFELFLRKIEAVIRSDRLLFARPELDPDAIRYHLASADALAHLPDESADYVFTDPPFGSNIFYSDMHLFHEAWLGEVTDAQHEAVVRTVGATGEERAASTRRYERLLEKAFAEAARVLKPGRFLSVVFGNSKGSLWALLLRALRDAGFPHEPVHVAILDKGQRSVKGLASGSERVVTVDLVLTFQKPTRQPRVKVDSLAAEPSWDINSLLIAVSNDLNEDQARNPSYLYVSVLKEAIRRGVAVERLQFGDVLEAIEEIGYTVDARSGLLDRPLRVEGDAGSPGPKESAETPL
jgi:16S rRNA G966 N2-methylase RsmD